MNAVDMQHGRRGGGWLPDDYEAIDFGAAPRCDAPERRRAIPRARGLNGVSL